MMQSQFNIIPSSELMAILAIIRDLPTSGTDRNITLAFDKSGKPVTAQDLEVAGAMTAWMRNTINPTSAAQPNTSHPGSRRSIREHRGGQSSIIVTGGLKLFDYHVTESGFGADIDLKNSGTSSAATPA